MDTGRKKGMPNTFVGVLYITPNTRNLAEFQQQALELVQDKQKEGLEVVIMGDFNAHFSEHRVEMDHRASLLLSMSNTLGVECAELVDTGVREIHLVKWVKKVDTRLYFDITVVGRTHKESSH